MKKTFNRQLWLRVMRFSVTQVLLMLFFLTVSYASEVSAQEYLNRKLTLKINNKEIGKVFGEIEKETGVRFMYSSNIIEVSKKVSIEAEQKTLSEILSTLLTPIGIDYELSGRKILLSAKPQKPVGSVVPIHGESRDAAGNVLDRKISGNVVDANNEPLPGVSIVLKGTQQGTISDASGAFSLEVPEVGENMLVFSYVGYVSKEIPAGAQSTLTVTLDADLKALEEVVVVGYGTQSRRNVTGSVAKIDMKQTEGLPNTNVAQSLRGRVAGVQFLDNGRPGQSGSILIRGRRSVTAGNDPLIVLDGVFFNGSLADINPNDIESMEILKDASAAAIYGARAANGVILISSRFGTSSKPTIRFNTFVGASDWSNRVQLLTPERYVQKLLDYRTQMGLESDPAKITDYLQTTEAENYRNDKTIDPWDEISQNGSGIRSYDLSISGRSERTTYLLSGAFVNEKGLIYNDKAKRVTLRANLENKITDWLTIGVNGTYARRDVSGADANLQWAALVSPYGRMYYDEARTDPARFPQDIQTVPNPIFNTIKRQNEEVYHNIFANFYAKVDVPFIKGLGYRINYSPNYRWDHNYNFMPIYQRNGDNMLGEASKYNQERFDWVLENILTYNRQLSENHAFDITLLYGRNHSSSESTTATASNFFNGANGWNNLGLAQVQQTTSFAQNVEGISSMARLNYRFKERYLFTVTARRDGSSVFGANNKFATFPSAAVAWIASDESFIKNIPGLDLLKVRASYGAVGNQAISPYQSLSSSGIVRYVFGDGSPTYTGTVPGSMANTGLKWETTISANAAIDFEILKRRISGTIEYYNMNTRDLLISRSLPSPTGFASVLTNLGATNNSGIELSFSTLNIAKGPFEWSSNLVFSSNKNKIVHIYQRDLNNDGREDDDLGNLWFIGKPVQVIYDYTFDGIYQEGDELPAGYKPGYARYKDINGDGMVNAGDRSVLGQREPRYRWGLTNNFKYRNFSLSVFVNALSGWKANSNFEMGFANYPAASANHADGGWWTAENKSNTVPSLAYVNPLGANFYQSRNFVRIQDVMMSYEVPRKWLEKAKVTSLRLFVSGKNLATFTKWKGLDPEIGSGSNGYPMPRLLTGGLNLSF